MDVKLIVEKGSARQQAWRLHHKDTIVGRRRDCDLRILSSEVSRRHCVLRVDGGSVDVEDLDSINGTYVNGSRVVGRQVLSPGDHLEIGPLQFIVEYEPQAGHDQGARPRVKELRDVEAADEHEVYDVLPLVREQSHSAQPEANPAEEEPLLVSDIVEDADWHLPQTGDLRDLLSQMDQSASRPPRREP